MNKKLMLALLLGALALVIAGAVIAYGELSARFRPEIALAENTGTLAQTSAPEAQQSELEKYSAPDFAVEDIDGNSVKLSDMLGKPVVVNFWASWCPPCKAEMPEFDAVYGELGGEVVFMMVDLTDGRRETRAAGEKYVADKGFSFPVYFDTEQQAASAYGIRSIPTTIFIDSEGYIAAGVEGQIDADTLRYGISLIYGGDAN